MPARISRRHRVKTAAPGGPGTRECAAQAMRDAMLRAAIDVFARPGRGRIEQVSKAANSHDRMIYYGFGSKQGLFVEVLEELYRRFNQAEAKPALDLERPLEALETVTRFVCRHYRERPEFVALLNVENLHKGQHISRSLHAREYSSPAIGLIETVLESGVRKRLFRAGLRARDVYLMIASMGYFSQSNRYALSAFLGGLRAAEAQRRWESFALAAVARVVGRHAAPGTVGCTSVVTLQLPACGQGRAEASPFLRRVRRSVCPLLLASTERHELVAHALIQEG